MPKNEANRAIANALAASVEKFVITKTYLGILFEAGMQNQILSAPWQRIMVESSVKSDVLVFALARTKEREENYDWITPFTQNAYSVFTHASNESFVSSIDEIPKNATVAVLNGDFRHDILKRAGLNVIPSEDWLSTVQLFSQGKADYLLCVSRLRKTRRLAIDLLQ